MGNMIKSLLGVLILALSLACSHKSWEIVVITSPDKSQSITVITQGNIRYIIDGKHKKIPNEDYVKLDISKVSPIGDQIGICWNVDGYNWRFVNDESQLIENKLDRSLFDFKCELEKTKQGGPTFKEYLYENCVRISIRENRVDPENGAILNYY